MRKHSRCSINEIGRVVIPAQIRRQLELKEDTPVEIFSKEGHIHIRKYQDSCVLCRSVTDLVTFKEQLLCRGCIHQLTDKPATTSAV